MTGQSTRRDASVLNSTAGRARTGSTYQESRSSAGEKPFRVYVDLSEAAYMTLAQRAEELGHESIPELLASVVDRIRGTKDTLDEKLLSLHALGLDDGQIAERMQTTRHSAANRRRGLRLPPNPPNTYR